MTPWYQSRWWYVERPFPWLLVALYLIPILVVAGGIAVGVALW